MPSTERAPLWAPGPVAVVCLLAAAVAQPTGRGLQLAVAGALFVALGAAGWRLAGQLVPAAPGASRAVVAICCAVFLARTSLTVLGQLGWLRPAAALACLALASGMVLLLPPAMPPRRPVANPRGAGPPAALLVATGAITLTGAALLVRPLLYAPAGRFQFDDISYHLTAVATWLRHADLRMVRFGYGDPSTAFYPIGGELVSWLLVAPFRDSDFLARWSELPFALGSLLAIAAIGRGIGLPARWIGFAVVAYAAIPRLLPLALGAGNDHAAAFFALAAVDAALLVGRGPRVTGVFGGCAAAALAVGLLVGTKYTGVLLAAPLVMVAVVALTLRSGWTWRSRAALRVMSIALGVAAVAGGYTYIRNLASTGNPVFPAPITVFGAPVFPGWEETGIAARRREPGATVSPWAFFVEQRSSLGPLFAYVLLPGALLAPFLALRARAARAAPDAHPGAAHAVALGDGGDRPAAATQAAVLALPIVWFAIFTLLVHDHRDVRYILAALAIAALASARLLAALPRWLGTPFAALALLVMLVERLRLLTGGETSARLLAAGLLFGATLAHGAWWIARRGLPRPGRLAAAVATVTVLALLPFAGPVVGRYQRSKLAVEPAAAALETLASAGVVVAYIGLNAPYHFFGSGLQNDVLILPTALDPAAEFHAWGVPPARPAPDPRVGSWLRRLQARGIELIVLDLMGDPEPYRAWILKHPKRFERVFADRRFEIWRVFRDLGGGPEERGTGVAGGTMPQIEN